MSDWNREQWTKEEYRIEIAERTRRQFLGERNPNYRHDLTDEEREINRATPQNIELRRKVYKRDNYTCQACGDGTGGNLVMHHLDGWNWAIDKRYHLRNVITLCDDCHKEYHGIYGYGDNFREDFRQWLKDFKEDLKASN
jgi:hypothetical protein